MSDLAQLDAPGVGWEVSVVAGHDEGRRHELVEGLHTCVRGSWDMIVLVISILEYRQLSEREE